MIKSVGDLINALVERERQVLARHPVKHPGTIGAMYEGLSQEVLRRALPFNGPTLSVVTGFAKGSDGTMSLQLDTMLVIGEGEPVPHTNQVIVPVDDVVAVIEVKKTLYQSEFDEGFKNLQSVVGLKRSSAPRGLVDTVRTTFEQMTGQSLPGRADDIVDPVARQIYHQLIIETASPARILLGFHGFKSAGSLRRGVGAHLRSLVGAPGSGPSSMPDLIMTPEAAVLKTNGLPYSGPVKDGTWPLLVSSASATPARILLEIVWTRLFNRAGGCPDAFGEDLELDALCRFVDYRFVPSAGAWEAAIYDDVPNKQLGGDAASWEPVFLDDAENFVVTFLCNNEELELDKLPAGAQRPEIEVAIKRLGEAGLVGPDAKAPNVFRLLTKQCDVVFLPDGRIAAGENNSGRLTRWVERETKQKPMHVAIANLHPDTSDGGSEK